MLNVIHRRVQRMWEDRTSGIASFLHVAHTCGKQPLPHNFGIIRGSVTGQYWPHQTQIPMISPTLRRKYAEFVFRGRPRASRRRRFAGPGSFYSTNTKKPRIYTNSYPVSQAYTRTYSLVMPGLFTIYSCWRTTKQGSGQVATPYPRLPCRKLRCNPPQSRVDLRSHRAGIGKSFARRCKLLGLAQDLWSGRSLRRFKKCFYIPTCSSRIRQQTSYRDTPTSTSSNERA